MHDLPNKKPHVDIYAWQKKKRKNSGISKDQPCWPPPITDWRIRLDVQIMWHSLSGSPTWPLVDWCPSYFVNRVKSLLIRFMFCNSGEKLIDSSVFCKSGESLFGVFVFCKSGKKLFVCSYFVNRVKSCLCVFRFTVSYAFLKLKMPHITLNYLQTVFRSLHAK